MTDIDLLGRLTRLAEMTSEQVAGNGSEWVAGFKSESLAGLIGIRTPISVGFWASRSKTR